MSKSAREIFRLQKDFVVANRLGIHARVAAQIVKAAAQFESEVHISKSGVSVSGKSILDLMTLICPHGSTIQVTVEGPDAPEALDALASLFQTKFGEP